MSELITCPNSVKEEEDEVRSQKRIRTAFTPQQRTFLEAAFHHNTLPSTAHIETLAERLKFKPKVIRTWFQNRRTYARKRTYRDLGRRQSPDSSDYVYSKPSIVPPNTFQDYYSTDSSSCVPSMVPRAGLSTRHENTAPIPMDNHFGSSSRQVFTPTAWNSPPFYYSQFNPYFIGHSPSPHQELPSSNCYGMSYPRPTSLSPPTYSTCWKPEPSISTSTGALSSSSDFQYPPNQDPFSDRNLWYGGAPRYPESTYLNAQSSIH